MELFQAKWFCLIVIFAERFINGEIVTINTISNEYYILSDYGIPVKREQGLTFDVKACEDADVNLLTASQKLQYQIRMDDNDIAILSSTNYLQGKSLLFLQCNSFKSVRILWQYTNIQIEDRSNNNVLLVHNTGIALDMISNIGIVTRGYQGEWIFYIQDTTTLQYGDTTDETTPQQTTDETTPQQTTDETTPQQTTDETTPQQTTNSGNMVDFLTTENTTTDRNVSTSGPLLTCICPCLSTGATFFPNQDANGVQTEVENTMIIDKKSTSKYIRTKISASDDRSSSRNIGIVAIIACCLPFVLAIVSDIFTFKLC